MKRRQPEKALLASGGWKSWKGGQGARKGWGLCSGGGFSCAAGSEREECDSRSPTLPVLVDDAVEGEDVGRVGA